MYINKDTIRENIIKKKTLIPQFDQMARLNISSPLYSYRQKGTESMCEACLEMKWEENVI